MSATSTVGRNRPVVARSGFSTQQPAMLGPTAGLGQKRPFSLLVYSESAIKKVDSRYKWSPLIVASCTFIALLVLGSGASYLQRNQLSNEDACTRKCSFQNKVGKLYYVSPREQTAGMGGRGRQECRCQ